MLPAMTIITKAIAALPRPVFNGMDYPVGYAQKLLVQHSDLIPEEHRARAHEEANTPRNSRGKPRVRTADRGITLWHAFRYWCTAEGQDLGEATRLLAAEYMARAGIEKPADLRQL